MFDVAKNVNMAEYSVCESSMIQKTLKRQKFFWGSEV